MAAVATGASLGTRTLFLVAKRLNFDNRRPEANIAAIERLRPHWSQSSTYGFTRHHLLLCSAW